MTNYVANHVGEEHRDELRGGTRSGDISVVPREEKTFAEIRI